MTSPTSEDTSTKSPEAPAEAASASGFLPATVDELKLVWPSRQQLFSESIAVILLSACRPPASLLRRFFGWASSQVFR